MNKELAIKCRKAVFRQVEDDRCLNAENIDLVIEKEIAVARPPEQAVLQLNRIPQHSTSSASNLHLITVVTRAQMLIMAVHNLDKLRVAPGNATLQAVGELEKAIKDAGF